MRIAAAYINDNLNKKVKYSFNGNGSDYDLFNIDPITGEVKLVKKISVIILDGNGIHLHIRKLHRKIIFNDVIFIRAAVNSKSKQESLLNQLTISMWNTSISDVFFTFTETRWVRFQNSSRSLGWKCWWNDKFNGWIGDQSYRIEKTFLEPWQCFNRKIYWALWKFYEYNREYCHS